MAKVIVVRKSGEQVEMVPADQIPQAGVGGGGRLSDIISACRATWGIDVGTQMARIAVKEALVKEGLTTQELNVRADQAVSGLEETQRIEAENGGMFRRPELPSGFFGVLRHFWNEQTDVIVRKVSF